MISQHLTDYLIMAEDSLVLGGEENLCLQLKVVMTINVRVVGSNQVDLSKSIYLKKVLIRIKRKKKKKTLLGLRMKGIRI